MCKCLICQVNESGSQEVEICQACLRKLELYFCAKCLRCHGYTFIPLPKLPDFLAALDTHKIGFEHLMGDGVITRHILLLDKCPTCALKGGSC